MKQSVGPIAVLFFYGSALLAAGPAFAEDAKPGISVAGSVTLVNDYIWRGQSQTWGRPAMQLAIEASHLSGGYAGFWASNVSDQWVPGGHVETDWYVGYRNKLPGALSEVGYDLNVMYVYYPGGNFDKTGFVPTLRSSRPNAIEAYAALSYKWITLKTGRVLTDFYGWNTHNSPLKGGFAGDPSAGVTGDTRGSWFIEANASYEFAPGWSVNGQVGRETISHSENLDWSYYKAGVTRTIGSWAASLGYSASNEPDAFRDFVGLTNNGDTYDAMRPRVLFSFSRSF